MINNKCNKLIETLISRSLEFKVFLSSKQKNQIFTYLKSYFEIEGNFTHNYIQYTSPGNLIKFDPIINELEITSLNEFDKVSSEILKMFNKTKKDIYINFLLFLIDIKFLELEGFSELPNFLEQFSIDHKELKNNNSFNPQSIKDLLFPEKTTPKWTKLFENIAYN